MKEGKNETFFLEKPKIGNINESEGNTKLATAKDSNLLRWVIYPIDLVVDNLL